MLIAELSAKIEGSNIAELPICLATRGQNVPWSISIGPSLIVMMLGQNIPTMRESY